MGRWTVALGLSILLCGCPDEDGLLPCPPKGIGVEPLQTDVGIGPGECAGGLCYTGRESCGNHPDLCRQIREYARYACSTPQVCPDVGPGAEAQSFLYDLTSESAARVVSVLLTNCSTGNQDLVIDRVEIFGDARCSFTEVSDADIGKKVVAPGETTAIRTSYRPLTVGEDHAELRVYSNADNFPELRLLICGIAVDGASAAPDAGSLDAALGDAACADLECLTCLPQTTQVACHK
jgi:hypothetical protein